MARTFAEFCGIISVDVIELGKRVFEEMLADVRRTVEGMRARTAHGPDVSPRV